MVSTVAEVLEWAEVLGTDYALDMTDEFGPVVTVDGCAVGWSVWRGMAVIESVDSGEDCEDDGATEIDCSTVGVRWSAGDSDMTIDAWLELIAEIGEDN